jgi:hypothetical protein
MELATRVVRQQITKPPVVSEVAQDPTVTRYGWLPFKKVNLCGPDGTMAIPAQPYEIAGPNGEPIRNPYFSELPKGQLIPFPTFTRIEQQPSQDRRDGQGRAMLDSIPRQVSALEAIVLVARAYGDQGFTRLNSLTGIDQEVAQRIFTVVQPFDYPIGKLPDELNFGAEERIDSDEELVFDLGGGQEYVVDCLRDDTERDIARRLVAEMLVGADVAFTLASDTLNATNTSITTRFAGGQGKVGGDAHDRYLEQEEVGQVVRPLKSKETDNSALESKVDFLVSKEVTREQQERIDRLERENAELRNQAAAKPAAETSTAIVRCGFPKVDTQEPCQVPVKTEGDRCPHHRDKEIDAAA